MKRVFIAGGAGFIGSHFVDRLLADPIIEKVTVYDNFSSGRPWHYEHHINDSRFKVFACQIKDMNSLIGHMYNHDAVIHLASNPDIAKAATDPDIDFWQGTRLTNNIVEAMRQTGVKKLLYASGSGVYGDLGDKEAQEDHGPLLPISTYGASKLAGETLICSYCHMFDLTACVFRFGNVVGARQTHGVGYDFTKKLLQNPNELNILGNGSQSKSYVHVSDIVNAVLLAGKKCTEKYQVFNVATGDYITVKEIAELTAECLGLDNINFIYSGGDRGWKGDVPVIRLNTDRIKNLGWQCSKTSKEAIKSSILEMLPDFKLNRM